MSYCDRLNTGDASRKQTARDVILKPWQEVIGTCIAIEKEDSLISIVLKVHGKDFRLSIECNSIRQPNAPLPIKPFFRQAVGRTVSVLRTDDTERPFAVRIVPEDAH